MDNKYLDLAVRLRYEINQQALPAGAALPSSQQYARMYRVSRTTMYRALKLVAQQGVIAIVHGRGNYVLGAGGDPGVRTDRPGDRIEQHLRAAVKNSQPGGALPGTQALMKQYGVSHPTVRRVQKRLSGEGLIRRTQDGTYVRA